MSGKMSRKIKRIILYSFLLSLLLPPATVIFPQSKATEEVPDIRFGKITLQTRDFESVTPPRKILEVQVEILNKSGRIIAPPNSVRVVVVQRELKYPGGISAAEFKPTRAETTITDPLPPGAGRTLVFGFSFPEQKPDSITFEIQINPPDGENSTVTWARGD